MCKLDNTDNLSTARGVFNGVAISIVFWAVIGLIVYMAR
jgi:hypothetical protein